MTGMADHLNERRTAALALTPHPGEMARLLGVTAKDVQARRLDARSGSGGALARARDLEGFSYDSRDAFRDTPTSTRQGIPEWRPAEQATC